MAWSARLSSVLNKRESWNLQRLATLKIEILSRRGRPRSPPSRSGCLPPGDVCSGKMPWPGCSFPAARIAEARSDGGGHAGQLASRRLKDFDLQRASLLQIHDPVLSTR